MKARYRKPLIIRGARQVGKTWLIRHFAQKNNKILIELNFEKQLNLVSLFSSNDPAQILMNIKAAFDIPELENALLFLDEIQAAPELISRVLACTK